jgi:hypothetical protein
VANGFWLRRCRAVLSVAEVFACLILDDILDTSACSAVNIFVLILSPAF